MFLLPVQDMCNELYNGEFDSSRDWLDCLMQDDSSCLLEDCMLMSGVGTSLNQPSPPVNSEHSYSLAVDLSQSAPDVAAKLDDCMYCWLSLVLIHKILVMPQSNDFMWPAL